MTTGTPSSLVEVDCPVCGSNSSRLLFHVKDWVLETTEAMFGVRKCRVCGCGYVSPRPPATEMKAYYGDDYYWSFEGSRQPLSWPEVINNRKEQLFGKYAVVQNVRPGRLLDVGAQKGEFMWYMRERGWHVEGVELDHSVPNPGSMPITYGDVLTLPFSEGTYDLVTAWAVLEHFYEPARLVERVASLLKPGGRFAGVVTNLNSVQARLFKADDFPRHLTLFTSTSLRLLAERCGLEMCATWTDQRIFGGALNGAALYLLKRAGGYSEDEARREWKDWRDPLAFYAKWRGRRSVLVLNVSRLDRALTWVPEVVLDRLGLGFNLCFVMRKP